MRIPLGAAVLACLALSAAVHAGEALLGKIIVTDGGTASNRCTATPFVIPGNAKLTLQCDEAVSAGTGVTGCDAGTCLSLTAGQIFPTSVGAAQSLTCNGTTTHYGGWLAVGATGATATCKVFQRSGTE